MLDETLTAIGRRLVHLWLIALPVLVVVDLVIELPPLVFLGLLGLLAVSPFVLERLFERKDPERFQGAGLVLVFQVADSSLVFTGDFNFGQMKKVAVQNGEIHVRVSASGDRERITGITISHAAPEGIKSFDQFVVRVDFGLLYVTDGIVIDRPELQKSVRDAASEVMVNPTAEVIQHNSIAFGVLIRPSYGNGEYGIEYASRTIRGVFE